MQMSSTKWGHRILGEVDSEVERLVNNSYLVAKDIVEKNRPLLDHLAKTLVEQEVVSAEEFEIMLVEFKAETVPFAVHGKERNRKQLPFQDLPPII